MASAVTAVPDTAPAGSGHGQPGRRRPGCAAHGGAVPPAAAGRAAGAGAASAGPGPLAAAAAAGPGPRSWGGAAVRPLRDRWHRSLQLRVVGTTLVVSMLVVAVLGFFVMQQLASGLLDSTEKQANSQVVTAWSRRSDQSGLATKPHDSTQAKSLMYWSRRNCRPAAGLAGTTAS